MALFVYPKFTDVILRDPTMATITAYSDDSALLFRRKAPGSSEGFGPGFPSDCGHVFRVNRPFCTGRIGA